MDVDERIAFFLELMRCGHDIWYWQFDADFQLITTTCPHEPAFQRLVFGTAERRQKILDYAQHNDLPLLCTNPASLEWATVLEKENGALKRLHILGPYFSTDMPMRTLEALFNKHYMSMRYRRRALAQLEGVITLPFIRFCPYLQMLHYCVTGERIVSTQVQFEEYDKNAQLAADVEDVAAMHAGVYAAEQELFSMISEGNPNYAQAYHNAVMTAAGDYGQYVDAHDNRLATAVKFITLSVRAAIRGGLSPMTAYAVGNRYETAAVNSKSLTETKQVLDAMFDDFVNRVRRVRENAAISKPIQVCCDYVDLHIYERIELDQLASAVGYTKYYLTRKFKQEMGMSIWDYINKQKVERAKRLLADPARTIQDVADQLNYCSRSYFSEIFQQHTGMWPSDYRTGERMR